jgi:hypothetical protein
MERPFNLKGGLWFFSKKKYSYDHILCLLMEDNDNPIIIRPHIVFRDRPFNLKGREGVMVFCFIRPSVNTICGRIMIGLSLSSVSKHNMWSYYDWVVVVVVRQ